MAYSPASTLQSNLPQSTVIFYDKKFVDNLKANTPWLRVTERRPLPVNSGNQLRMYMYNTFAANTTPVSEGTVGTGITPSVANTTATIGQYADFVSISDLAMETAIDPALENIQTELAYRLALSVNALVQATADGANAVDSSVAVEKAANTPAVASDVRSAIQALVGRNVKPFNASGTFAGIIHPFVVGDILNDTNNNGLTDILKRTAEGTEKLVELPGQDEVGVLDFAGARFFSSTLVKITSNYATSGKNGFRTYLFGKDAVISISLGAMEGTQIGDGDWRNLKLWLRKMDEPTLADPSRVIGGFTSYNVKFTTSLPPDTTMRMRYIDANSNIS